ncbi:MAG: hypothetical protein M0R77_02820 [Gammaproteobacteria bacterium]|nr:hypothetical protein [Gammaproteobacteria bacterium]
MKNCYQFENVNMMDHGNMVHEYYVQLYNNQTSEWDFGKVGDLIKKLISLASPPEDLRLYHIYHDCGKPRCRSVDEQGRQHFPNHAQMSYNVWIEAGGDEETAWYILHDMDFHILKIDELEQLIQDPRAINLLLTAWSEIHANSQMFGGTESTSFKIKRKHLEKATKLIVSNLRI